MVQVGGGDPGVQGIEPQAANAVANMQSRALKWFLCPVGGIRGRGCGHKRQASAGGREIFQARRRGFLCPVVEYVEEVVDMRDKLQRAVARFSKRAAAAAFSTWVQVKDARWSAAAFSSSTSRRDESHRRFHLRAVA